MKPRQSWKSSSLPTRTSATDQRAVLLGGASQFETALGGLGAHSSDQAGQMQDAHALLTEDALHIELVGRQCPANFAGTVIPHTGGTHTKAAVGDVELVAESPRAALLHLSAFIADVAGTQVIFDELGDGAALDKLGQHQTFLPQRSGDVQNVGFSAGGLHIEVIAVVDSHAVVRSDADAHTGGAGDGIAVIAAKVHFHDKYPLVKICSQ